MRRVAALLAAAVVISACTSGGTSPSAGSGSAAAGGCVVGVSWNNFQQPRWAATDKPKMKQTIEAGGGTFIDADANLDNQRQLSDVDTLISKGAKVLVLLAQDNKAILPALQKAKDAGIPVIAYDRLIEDPSGSILYITFDNVGVGKAEAEAILSKVPKGNYVLIKGDPGDANASTFLPSGWNDAGLKDKIASGDIKIIGPKDGTYTDAWKTEKAQANMEAIIDQANAANKKIDAILAENDSTALGVVAALQSKNYGFPPLSGQDGDPANLNNVALGKQYVDVWKNSNELGKAAGQAALQLCQGKKISEVSITVDSSVAPAAGNSPTDFKTPGGNTVKSIILKPTPVTADSLDKVISAGWYADKAAICKGVDTSSSTAPAACK
ncbi:MAG: substrate-binding domain-containing protein [Chloroflexi bacterium]|nr:MAG: substrate-binding domain-containing protein [Chloroflexota bacterium]